MVDLETTGWSPEVAAITEIAAVRVTGAGAVGWGARRGGGTGTRRSNGAGHADGRDDRAGHGDRRGDRAGQAEGARREGQAGGRREFVRLGEFASLVDPGVPVPPGIAELTGINDSMLAAAPRLGAVLPRLLEFSRGCVLVAHNAPFDLRFLVAASTDCGVAWPGFTVLDTVMLARRVMDPDEVADCKLGTLAGFFGARTAPSHRALADARATADVLSWLIAARAPGHPHHPAAQRLAGRSSVSASPRHGLRPHEQPGRHPVVTAIVLVRAEIQRIPEVAEEIAQLPEVSEVYSVTGEFDLVAMVRVRAHDELADVIPGRRNKVPGVTHTETHIAFRTYSRHDLDAAFSLGLAADS